MVFVFADLLENSEFLCKMAILEDGIIKIFYHSAIISEFGMIQNEFIINSSILIILSDFSI